MRSDWLLPGRLEECLHLLQQPLHLCVVIHEAPNYLRGKRNSRLAHILVVHSSLVDNVARMPHKVVEFPSDGVSLVPVLSSTCQILQQRCLQSFCFLPLRLPGCCLVLQLAILREETVHSRLEIRKVLCLGEVLDTLQGS